MINYEYFFNTLQENLISLNSYLIFYVKQKNIEKMFLVDIYFPGASRSADTTRPSNCWLLYTTFSLDSKTRISYVCA